MQVDCGSLFIGFSYRFSVGLFDCMRDCLLDGSKNDDRFNLATIVIMTMLVANGGE